MGRQGTRLGGTSEGNNRGIECTANATFNYFLRLEMVQNVVYDIECAGAGNIFDDCYSQNAVTFLAGAKTNTLRDGFYGGAITNSSALAQRHDGITLSIAAVAAFSDAISPALYWSNVDNLWHHRIPGLVDYANNAAALAGGLVVGDVYRTGGAIMVVI